MELRDRLIELFDYDPETGWFTNKTSRGRAAAGARAGSSSGHGYRKITIDYAKYYEHHLAWLYVHGYMPNELDHIDGDGCFNAIENLRECDRSQNNFNNQSTPGASGLRGAYLDKRNLQWYSKIQVRGESVYLGNYDSPEEAHEAYLEAAERYAGEFAFHARDPQPMKEAG
jgi:hypothetical protein